MKLFVPQPTMNEILKPRYIFSKREMSRFELEWEECTRFGTTCVPTEDYLSLIQVSNLFQARLLKIKRSHAKIRVLLAPPRP